MTGRNGDVWFVSGGWSCYLVVGLTKVELDCVLLMPASCLGPGRAGGWPPVFKCLLPLCLPTTSVHQQCTAAS